MYYKINLDLIAKTVLYMDGENSVDSKFYVGGTMKRYQGSKKKARRVAYLQRKEKRIIKAMLKGGGNVNNAVQGSGPSGPDSGI